MKRILATFCFAALLATTPVMAADDCPSITGGWYRGPTSTAAVDGRVAVMGDGAYLKVIDLDNPNAPKVLGELLLPDVARDVELDGSHAFVATGVAGLVVVDIADPASPRVVATAPVSHKLAHLALQGDQLVASEWGLGASLHVIDVGDPASPVATKSFRLELRNGNSSPSADDVVVAGDHVLVVGSDAWQFGLHVVSLASPSAPTEIAFLEVPADVVAASGSFAFTAGWSYDTQQYLVSSIDLDDPTQPVVMSQLATDGSTHSGQELTVEGDDLYLFRGPTPYFDDLSVFDIKQLASPREVATLDLNLPNPDDPYALALDFAVSDGLAVVASGSAGLQALDLSTPTNPRLGGQVAARQPLGKLEVFGNAAYAIHNLPADGSFLAQPGAIEIFDLSNPAEPVQAGAIDINAQDMAIGNGHAYIGGIDESYHPVIRIFDLSDPLAPQQVAAVEAPHGSKVVTYADGRLFAAGNGSGGTSSGITIFELSEPVVPQQIASVDVWFCSPYDMAVDGDRLYLLHDCGLDTYDVADPSSPSYVRSEYQGYSAHLAVAGGMVFLSDNSEGLRIHDGRDGSLFRKMAVSGRPKAVAANGTTLLLAEDGWGLRSFDISDPRHPIWLKLEPVPGLVGDIVMTDDMAFVTGDAGITAVATAGCSPLLTQLFIPAAAHAEGVGGSQWTTDVEVANAGAGQFSVQFRFLPRGTGGCEEPLGQPWVLLPGQARRWRDIWGETYGSDGGGAIVIRTSDPDAAMVTSRTFNSGSSGSFGQGIAAVADHQLIGYGERARLVQLSQTGRFRSNIGFLNPGPAPIELMVELFAADGSSFGTEALTLPPCESDQWTRAFRRVTQDNVEDGWADVWTTTPDGLFFTYGSVVDNMSNDPTTIVPRPAGGTLVPAAASAEGLGGAMWTTDLELNNLGDTAVSYQFKALPRGRDNSAAALSEPFTLDAGAGVRYTDIWGELAGEGAGAIEIVTDTPEALLVMSRTYNTSPNGSFGQGIPGIAPDELFGPGEVARIIQLSQVPHFRSNVGLVNASDTAVTIEVRFFDRLGEELGVDGLTLAPLANAQWSEAFTRVTAAEVHDGYVEVRSMTQGAKFYAYGSVVDNRTGDPTTILPR